MSENFRKKGLSSDIEYKSIKTNSCVTLTWVINNYSCCWQKNDEAIVSPMFCIYMPEETKWKIMLFPRGVDSHEDCISLFFYRDKDCNGSDEIEIEYTVDIVVSDGSCAVDLPETVKFRKDMQHGSPRYIYRTVVTRTHRWKYLPQDCLTIRCKIYQFGGKTVEKQQIFARTIIGFEKLFFLTTIENFLSMEHNRILSFIIKSETKDNRMQMNLALTNKRNEPFVFGLDSLDPCLKFCRAKISIMDYLKLEVDFGEYDYWFTVGKCTMLPLKLTGRTLFDNRDNYLPNDALTLSFEFTVSTGFAFEGIENVACRHRYSISDEVTNDWRQCISHKKMTDCPCALITDLTSLCEDQSACDMELQTKSDTFPVHTLILSARSPVFKTMFSNEMKEKINGCANVSDLPDSIVRKFLLYIYSDQLDDIKWDDAVQLYKAAINYAVNSLRDKCTMFLKSNLNEGNVCEALKLSDLHQDKDLKEEAQNFILQNAQVVFKSKEWKLLGETNAKLALETTLRNWKNF